MNTPNDQHRDGLFDGRDVTHIVITRAELFDCGQLIDVSHTDDARQLFTVDSVALTSGVWQECVHWPEDPPRFQSEPARLWDVLWMAHLAGRRNAAPRVDFTVYRIPVGRLEDLRTGGCEVEPEPVTLSIHIGPGDQGEPVVTILLPHED